MMDINDPKRAKRRGIIIGAVVTLIVLGVGAGLPYCWYSSGRDMQTFHDGLSTQFRFSLARIVNAEGYEAKNEFYDQSVTVTDRDNLLKYGLRSPGQFKESDLLNYIRWQGQIESEKRIFDTINELTTESGYTYPEHRKYLDDAKKRMRERIANMQAAHSMGEICREAVVKVAQDKTIESDSRCVTVPGK
jgi:hypothetical protein